MLAQPPIWFIALAFILAIGPLVFIHELGHYLVARWCGIGAEIFSIGFGREIVGWTDRRGTRWKVGWLPLGGYVRFVGDMNAASTSSDAELIANASPELRQSLFINKSVWRRIAVVAAGPPWSSGAEDAQFVQTYFVEVDQPNLIFAAYRPTNVIFDGSVWRRPDGTLRAVGRPVPGRASALVLVVRVA